MKVFKDSSELDFERKQFASWIQSQGIDLKEWFRDPMTDIELNQWLSEAHKDDLELIKNELNQS